MNQHRQTFIDAHRAEMDWMVNGYRRLADALERDINDVRITFDDQFPMAHVREDGEWATLGMLLDLGRLDESLAILRKLESDDGTGLT